MLADQQWIKRMVLEDVLTVQYQWLKVYQTFN